MEKRIVEILKIFSPAIAILITHTYLDINDIYQAVRWIDIPMHFLGGIAIGISYFLFLRFLQRNNYLGSMHNLVFFVFVISLVSLTALGWEFFEFFLDLLYPMKEGLGTSQPTVQDTMTDLLIGLTGGFIGYLLTLKHYKR